MTKHELMALMRLLSALETTLLFSGRQHLNQRDHIPYDLLERIADSVEVLEREILK